MDIIHLLPDSVANQIAAGEVIQRPASCLKELVENSLDAGATHIQVLVRDAGKTLLQVVDDGKGMSETDARMAFERHATSKIHEAADLFELRTMGFRGEALASICAVAQVEILTRQEEDELGTLLEIHGSTIVRQEPVQCPKGTNLKVKNLFYNVPARRKFLKGDQTERRNLLNEFYRIVLVYPEVQFTYIEDDEILIDLPVTNIKQRIETVFGTGGKQPFTSQLVEIRTDNDLVSIYGFIGKPEAATKNAKQYFFVNGRYMRHPYFHKAVLNAYTGMLGQDMAPAYFIYFEINPETIDVNIHPTKTEIKFADEQMIFPILTATIREALGKFNVAPSLDFNTDGHIEIPVIAHPEHTSFEQPVITRQPTYNPFHSSQRITTPHDWQQLYDRPSAPIRPSEPALPIPVSFVDMPLVQLNGKYILLPTDEGLLLVNQHRAHINILYDQYLRRLQDHDGQVQQLLFPDVWDVDRADLPLVEVLVTDLRSIGFDLTALTPVSYSINGVPAMVAGNSTIPVLQNILDTIRDLGLSAQQQWHEKIALSMAQSTAIPYGKVLTQKEMQHLLEELFALPKYRYTPDGKNVAALLSQEQIGRFF